jgi:hypothetical protein
MKITVPEFVDFDEEATTERGEKVYKSLEVIFKPLGGFPLRKILKCDTGIGITEEFIEDTIIGCMKALEIDFPNDLFKVIRLKPNQIVFQYVGARGLVN